MKCNFDGHPCQNYEDYVNGNCPKQCVGKCNYMGYTARKLKDSENLYLTTPDTSCYTSSIKFDVPPANSAVSIAKIRFFSVSMILASTFWFVY